MPACLFRTPSFLSSSRAVCSPIAVSLLFTYPRIELFFHRMWLWHALGSVRFYEGCETMVRWETERKNFKSTGDAGLCPTEILVASRKSTDSLRQTCQEGRHIQSETTPSDHIKKRSEPFKTSWSTLATEAAIQGSQNRYKRWLAVKMAIAEAIHVYQ